MLKNNKRSLQVTAIAITVTLLLVGASGHVAAKAKKITINHKKMTLAIGQKRALKVKNTKKKVKWISKNKKVAIVEKAYDRKYGARPLRRKLQDEVEDRLADALIRGEIHTGDRVIVTTKNKEIIVSKDKK